MYRLLLCVMLPVSTWMETLMTSRLDALKGKFTQIKEPKRDAVSDTASIENTVKDIIHVVAWRRCSPGILMAFDKADVATFEVTEEEKLKAVADLDPQDPRGHRVCNRKRSSFRRSTARDNSSA